MAMAHMFQLNERVDKCNKMMQNAASKCGIALPDENLESWQLKPPPNLNPEQQAAWFKMRNLVKRKKRAAEEAEQMDTLLPCYNLEIPDEKQKEIQRILNNVSTKAPPNVSQIRSGKNYEFQNVFEKYKHIEESDFKRKFLQSVTGSLEEKIRQNKNYDISFKRDPQLDYEYEQEWNKKIRNERYLDMLDHRRNLPAYNKVEDLIRKVNEEQVLLVVGETGCGKTTQVPQFILDFELKSGRGSICHIVCTQPRRISAISIAERVAQERAEQIGDSVGYTIRLETKKPRKSGSILFCTTGSLLMMMQTDPLLKNVSHVILDEIHERNTLSDFILAILKDIIKLRKDLKVILMSATMNAERFSEYFGNCPTIEIPGKTFPVTEYYLEDVLQMTGFRFRNNPNETLPPAKSAKEEAERTRYREEFLMSYIRSPQALKNYTADVLDNLLSPQTEMLNMDLIFMTIYFICEHEPPGAVLVFLPGWDRILKLLGRLENSGKFPPHRYLIVPLHSMLSTIAQKNVFSIPPPGVRKIVIATNIAETSITVDDVVYVVDSGMEKLSDFDTNDNIATLEERWISLANAKQRKGRAGRVRVGYCYKLYSRPKELTLSPFQLPEIMRTRLEEVILQTKVLQLGQTEAFLAKVMDPPSSAAVRLSLELLQGMNALDDEENLTPLGYHLAHLPVDPMAGKMMLLGALFGCLDPVSSIACTLAYKDSFAPPPNQLEAADQIRCALADGTKSDHILHAKVFSKWREAKSRNKSKEFAQEHFLNNSTLHMVRDLKRQLVRHLCDMGFLSSNLVEGGMANHNCDNIPLVRSLICAGLYPNIAIVTKVKAREQKGRYTVIMTTMEDQHVLLHQRSVNAMSEKFDSVFFAYFTKMKSYQMYLFDTTMVYPIPLIFFCHSFHVEELGDKKVIALNKRIRFSCTPETAKLLQEMRAWLDWLIDYKVAHPTSINWTMNNDETFILKAIIGLLSLELTVKDPEIPESALAELQKNETLVPAPNFGQFGNYYGNPSSQLLTLDQSQKVNTGALPWVKEEAEEIFPPGEEASGSDMSAMSGDEGLLSYEPKKKKKKKTKPKIKLEAANGPGVSDTSYDDRPWIRSVVVPLRDKELQVAIIIRDLQPMTYEECSVVRRALITDVGLALRGMGPGCNGQIIQPRFTESSLVPPGLLLISCLDEVSRDWLLAWTPPKLQFSSSRYLQVVKGNSLVWPEKLQVAVVLKDFLPMTSTDADSVRSGLVSDVSLVLGAGLSIKFTNLEFVDPGWLLITCLDKTSRDWVMKWNPPNVRTMKTYVVAADSLPWPHRIGFVLQSDQRPEWDSVCYYVRHQNESLQVDSWKFLESVQNSDGTWTMTFSVAPSEISVLDRLGWRLFYQIDYLTVAQYGKMPAYSAMAGPAAFPQPFSQPYSQPQFPAMPFQQPQPFAQPASMYNYYQRT